MFIHGCWIRNNWYIFIGVVPKCEKYHRMLYSGKCVYRRQYWRVSSYIGLLLQNNINRNPDLPGKLITFGRDKNNPQIWGLFLLCSDFSVCWYYLGVTVTCEPIFACGNTERREKGCIKNRGECPDFYYSSSV